MRRGGGARNNGHGDPMPRYFDLSLPISEKLITYPGDPPIRLSAHASIGDGDDANVTRLSFGSHTGTHVDAPLHFIDGARAIDEIPLDVLIGPVLVAEFDRGTTAIGEAELRAAGVSGETRVLLSTRNREFLDEEEFREDFTWLSGEGADYLLRAGVKLVGIDYLSIEEFGADEPVAHRKLLERDVVILEGVDLRGVPAGRYELICLPLRLAGLDGAPARVVLREEVQR
jgi:arylformamidase